MIREYRGSADKLFLPFQEEYLQEKCRYDCTFRLCYGMVLKKLAVKKRMEKSKIMLAYGGRIIQEVAA